MGFLVAVLMGSYSMSWSTGQLPSYSTSGPENRPSAVASKWQILRLGFGDSNYQGEGRRVSKKVVVILAEHDFC
ncbi:hypothetical protein B0T21DRAFT_357342 [Apiosordaria backusii]|uniref:Uncharacterized protein n=1 Tax=Apiosordaria backusii TaxID=314023 RepID=A0AA40F0H7_9PEZI|nr:hypothetical protein B0T21DRAFT_357342 [Apiosordaria backusii]